MDMRELRREDAASLSRLIAEVQAELPEAMTYGILPPEQIRETIEWKLDAIGRGAMADAVAIEGGEVVADCEVLCDGPEGTVGIIIGRSYRGRGTGKALLERCIARARDLGVRNIHARVMASNARAVSFFSGMGFGRVDATLEGIVIMSKEL